MWWNYFYFKWIYVVVLHLKILKKGKQREPNPSLQRGSQALKPLRYNALLEKGPNKRVYKHLYKLWIDFSRKWLSIGHKFLCSSTLLVEYYTTKKKNLLKSAIHNSRTPFVSLSSVQLSTMNNSKEIFLLSYILATWFHHLHSRCYSLLKCLTAPILSIFSLSSISMSSHNSLIYSTLSRHLVGDHPVSPISLIFMKISFQSM